MFANYYNISNFIEVIIIFLIMERTSKNSSLTLSKDNSASKIVGGASKGTHPSKSGLMEVSVNFELIDGTSNEQGSAVINRS